VASLWIQSVLALEIAKKGTAPESRSGTARANPTDERGEPALGASRIHGELLMLGFEVAQSTVSKYMVRGRKPPSQSWRTFLHNHAEAISAIDMCVVPTLTFERLFAFLALGQPAAASVDRNKAASDRRVASLADHRGLPLGISAGVFGARQRRCLWACLYRAGAGHRDPRPANLTALTMPEWLRGTPHRHRTSRVLGPDADLR
jgi:hypothetical protein